MIFRVQKVIGFATRIQLQNTTAFFAKEAKEASKKQGGKKDDKAPAPAMIQEVPLGKIALKWLQPSHPSLSPSELKYYNEGFPDLTESDKQILNDFAERIIGLPTAIFYDTILKKGSLGTSEMYYTSVDRIPQAQIQKNVKAIRKQL